MQLQGHEIRFGEATPDRLEADGHRRPEHRHPFIEPDHLLLVQPEERPVQQAGRILGLGPDHDIAGK